MKKLFLAPLLLLVVMACSKYPDEVDYVSDYDIVYTRFDDTKNFSSYSTYALPDKIAYLNGGDSEEYLDDDQPELAELIRAEVRSKMANRGYTEVNENTAKPDLLFNIGVFSQRNNIYDNSCWWYNDPYYWGWYGNWGWGPGSAWGYYPCWGSSYYSYQYGSLVFDLVDVANTSVKDCDRQDSSCELDLAWNSIIRGLLLGSDENIRNRIATSIDQSFTQSPYIKK